VLCRFVPDGVAKAEKVRDGFLFLPLNITTISKWRHSTSTLGVIL
jgi:hypothetical protein